MTSAGDNGAAAPPKASPLRLFVALPLPPVAAESALAAQAELVRRARRSRLEPRWTRPEQLHVTLKFLGYLQTERVGELEQVLARAASQSHRIESGWSGLGAFPNPRRARVIVARLADARAELLALYSRLEADLEPLGFALEERAFTAHVTLGRIKAGGNVEDWLGAATLAPTAFGLETLRLYRSLLRSTGALYDVLAEWRLGA